MFNLDILKEKKYSIIGTSGIKKMTMEDINNNVFSYFEDFKKLGFSFIRFPDQKIEIHNSNNDVFMVFGECHFGCFAIGTNGQILLLTYTDECFTDEVVFVNSSIHAFLSSYSLFMSKIYILKSVAMSEQKGNEDHFVKVQTEESKKLTLEIENIDKKAVNEGTFWEQFIYMIDDSIVKLNMNIVEYIDSGRFGS